MTWWKNTFGFTGDYLGHFCLPCHLSKEVMVKGAKSQVVVGVFLEDNATGVFGESYTLKDRRQPQGQSDPGKLPLTERLEPTEQHFTRTVHQFYLFVLQPTWFTQCFFVTMFVFIIECQLVLKKPPVLSKQWVMVVRVMTPCFSPSQGLQPACCL